MASDKKTLKFQMMMSPSEAEILDDWMFKNRVRSRAEAIRRLCQVGLSTAEHWKALEQAITQASTTNHLAVRIFEEDFFVKQCNQMDANQSRRYANTIGDAYRGLADLAEATSAFQGDIAPFLDTGITADQAERKSEEQREVLLARLRKRRASQE